MSNLSSYADIKTRVANWLNRQDLTDLIPDFISLAEADMRRNIRHDQGLIERVRQQVIDGNFNVPDNFNGVVSLKGIQRMTFVPPDVFDSYSPCEGDPTEYTTIGTRIYVYPEPADGYEVLLTYRIKVDVLRYGPNWLLENHPDAYIYGALVHAAPYIVEDERVPLWVSMYEKIKADINLDGVRQSSGGTLQLTSNGPR